jgi:hypothetical protein
MPYAIWGQAVSLSAMPAARGTFAPVTLSLSTPLGKEPVALQWEISYPSSQFSLEDRDLGIGNAAYSAGKSLTCSGRPGNVGTHRYRCILAGGQERIPNGQFAFVTFRVRADAQRGAATIQFGDALGILPDGKPMNIQPTKADVVIR